MSVNLLGEWRSVSALDFTIPESGLRLNRVMRDTLLHTILLEADEDAAWRYPLKQTPAQMYLDYFRSFEGKIAPIRSDKNHDHARQRLQNSYKDFRIGCERARMLRKAYGTFPWVIEVKVINCAPWAPGIIRCDANLLSLQPRTMIPSPPLDLTGGIGDPSGPVKILNWYKGWGVFSEQENSPDRFWNSYGLRITAWKNFLGADLNTYFKLVKEAESMSLPKEEKIPVEMPPQLCEILKHNYPDDSCWPV